MATKAGVHNLTKYVDSALSMDEFQAAKSEGKLMVIDCYATWCGPCKAIAPKVVAFSDKYPDVRFFKVDVDEVPDVAQELGIRAMPTFVLFKNGEEVAKVVGANPQQLEEAIVKGVKPQEE
ncbi:MAG: hypothetical protein Q9187_005297 [Circinaria calcarea]